MLTVTDLEGKEYAAISAINRVQRVNGEREITLSFLHNSINDDFLSEIETGWKANFKGDVYHLFNEREDKHGNKQFDAVLDFFHHFNGRWHVDEVDDQSMTINDSVRPLFEDSEYLLNIIDNFYANTMNYSKQQNSTERFLYFIGRHKAEFNIPIGTKTVQIRNKIGVQRNDILIHEDDNLVDFHINTDTGSFCTAIRYYYDFKSSGEGDNETEKEPTKNDVYISPMASKYGVHYGEPIYDERFSVKSNAEQAAKEKQEATWQSSFEISAERFETALGIGDEVPFVVPSKSINGYIRAVEINEDFDEDGELIEGTYTFGNENIANQYRKMQYDAIQDVSDILNGKMPIPYSVLPKAVREATNVIMAGDTTQFYYRANGIYGYNTENPLGVTRYNANGMGFSRDGGKTFENAMTYLGIVATAITSGTIDTNRVTIKSDTGLLTIEGDKFMMESRNSTANNLFNKARVGNGSISSVNGNVNSDGFKNTGFIALEPNTDYITNAKGTGAFYDANYSFVEGISSSTTSFRTESNVWYFRASLSNPQVETFNIYKESNLKTAVVITPEGMEVYGFDGRQTMYNGIMRGSRVANKNFWYDESIINFNGKSLVWDDYNPQYTYYIDDLYNGRFIDLLIATGLSERSRSASAHAIVKVLQFNGSIVAEERFFISRSSMDFRRIRCDLQAFYNTVPDYRTAEFYIEVQLDTAYSGNEIVFRLNRGDFYD